MQLNIHDPKRVIPNDSGGSVTFHLVLISGQNFLLYTLNIVEEHIHAQQVFYFIGKGLS